MERHFGVSSQYGATRPLSLSSCLRYTRGQQMSSRVVNLVLNHIFGSITSNQVDLQWVFKLSLNGTELSAGESWLSGKLDGKTFLAFIPQNGMFMCSGKIFLVLEGYPKAKADETYGLPTAIIPKGFKPTREIVHVGYQGLQNLIPLWPAKSEGGQRSKIRFVPCI